jgi:hypothetical protein
VLSALGLDMTDNMAAPGHDGPNEDIGSVGRSSSSTTASCDSSIRVFYAVPRFLFAGSVVGRSQGCWGSPRNRHDDPRLGQACQPLVCSVYRLARRADQDEAAREQAQTIAAQFVTFQQLHRAFQRDFEEQTAAVARLSALEGEAAALRERAGGAEAVQAEVERLRAQLDNLLHEQDEAVAAVAAARAETVAQRAFQTRREGHLNDFEEALGTVQNDVVPEGRFRSPPSTPRGMPRSASAVGRAPCGRSAR